MGDIIKIADFLTLYFTKKGFKVQRLEAKTTNSIYLKLDYGVCNSIRISDHPGKKHLKYRYNVLTNIDESFYVVDGYDRYFYRKEDLRILVKHVLDRKQEKIDQYTQKGYDRFMETNKKEKSNTKGFWSRAKLVNAEERKKITRRRDAVISR